MLDNLPALKDETLLTMGKTPVSLLQELFSRSGTTPKYELVQIEGEIHEPSFLYRVGVANIVAVGTGRSKKVAKHEAAKNLIEKLLDSGVNGQNNISTNDAIIPIQVVNSYDKISGNPIGTLQEMCIARKWSPPTYEMTCEEGLPHERQFTVTCVVLDYQEVGSGKSKKLAKRQAAYKMWKKLHENETLVECSSDPSRKSFDMSQCPDNFNSPLNKYADVKNSKIPTLTRFHSQVVSVFHRNLKHSTGEKLNELQVVQLNHFNFDYIEFLQQVANEQNFEVTFVNIEEKSMSGLYQCLVQLSTLPVAVCYGSGRNPRETQMAAAHNALEYLKIMTKK